MQLFFESLKHFRSICSYLYIKELDEKQDFAFASDAL